MNKGMQRGIQESIHKLQQYGFQDDTEAASREDGTQYRCVFETGYQISTLEGFFSGGKRLNIILQYL